MQNIMRIFFPRQIKKFCVLKLKNDLTLQCRAAMKGRETYLSTDYNQKQQIINRTPSDVN